MCYQAPRAFVLHSDKRCPMGTTPEILYCQSITLAYIARIEVRKLDKSNGH